MSSNKRPEPAQYAAKPRMVETSVSSFFGKLSSESRNSNNGKRQGIQEPEQDSDIDLWPRTCQRSARYAVRGSYTTDNADQRGLHQLQQIRAAVGIQSLQPVHVPESSRGLRRTSLRPAIKTTAYGEEHVGIKIVPSQPLSEVVQNEKTSDRVEKAIRKIVLIRTSACSGPGPAQYRSRSDFKVAKELEELPAPPNIIAAMECWSKKFV
uniref:Uncharacterized protein n=1 Tax=Caenorhabditis japonica TaxID=281687 RepID=A0A8R1INJ0_CAEJA